MIGPIIESAFPILWMIEAEPVTDILQLVDTNNPFVDPHAALPVPQVIMSQVPCLFTQTMEQKPADAVLTGPQTSLYFLEKDLTTPITDQMTFDFQGKKYTPIPGGILITFGLTEVSVKVLK